MQPDDRRPAFSMNTPRTHYTCVGDDRVAYQVLGDGPIDLVATAGLWGHIEMEWEDPALARFLRRLASFSRLIRFDPRGVGLSDARPSNDPREVPRFWIEDMLAVLTAVGSESFAMVAWISGQMALQFAASHPQRVQTLVLISVAARHSAAEDYPEGNSPEAMASYIDFARKYWGTERWAIAHCPSLANDARARGFHARWQRTMAAPKAIVQGMTLEQDLDARPSLAGIRAPTLVMARNNCRWLPSSLSRYLVDEIEGARFVELPGADLLPFWETPEFILDHIEEFITGQRHGGEAERALLTVLFTDVVDSTGLAAKLGDASWRALLDHHDQVVGEQLGRFGGQLIERTGDGTLASFDRPGRAIDCAIALRAAMEPLNLRLRTGLHTAEVEVRDDGRIGGISVHLAARVMAIAEAGEVLVSHTVQNLLLGSRYDFVDRGTCELKGVPGKWGIFAVRAA